MLWALAGVGRVQKRVENTHAMDRWHRKGSRDLTCSALTSAAPGRSSTSKGRPLALWCLNGADARRTGPHVHRAIQPFIRLNLKSPYISKNKLGNPKVDQGVISRQSRTKLKSCYNYQLWAEWCSCGQLCSQDLPPGRWEARLHWFLPCRESCWTMSTWVLWWLHICLRL